VNKKPERRDFKKGPPREGPPKGPRASAAQARGPAPESAAQQGPPDSTLRETNYLRSLVMNKTPVRIRLRDNAEVDGVVEYYDANFIRLTRAGEANLFIYKSDIKYLEEQS
jgi:sRNA-binding regulator protein Hfq